MSDVHAPFFELLVDGEEVDVGVTQLIRKVEYESADGIADIARITAVNPDFKISNANVFQTGREMDVWMGYGPSVEHIGRVIIAKNRPNFPQNAMPTIQVVGYTKDVRMMDNAPEKSNKRIHDDAKFSDIVTIRAEDVAYGFETDIDETKDQKRQFIHIPKLTDYDLVKGLSNITGYLFWVDGDSQGKWTLHFRDPEQFSDQDKVFTFQYNLDDMTSLLSFTPELLIKGAATKIAAQVKDTKSGKILKTEIEEENDESPDVKGDLISDLDADHTSASDIKLFIGEFSFEVVANRRFKDEAELTEWVRQWFRRQRENFVLTRGRLIGIETLKARQVHNLAGIGGGYDGEYYFSKVKHIMDNQGGYVIDFGARKQVPII